MRRIILMLLLLAVPVLSEAATRYAHPSGGGGNCTNPATPCSLSNAVNSLGNGDILILQGGTYPFEENEIQAPNVTVRVATGATVVLRTLGFAGTNLGPGTIDGGDGNLIFDGDAGESRSNGSFNNNPSPTGFPVAVGCGGDNSSGLVWKNFKVRHYWQQGLACGRVFGGLVQNVEFSWIGIHEATGTFNCHLYGEYPVDHKCHAMYIGGPDWTIDRVNVHDNEGMGVHAATSFGTDRMVVKNSQFRRFGGQAIGLYRSTVDFLFFNNVIAYNRHGPSPGDNGMLIYNRQGEIYNNTIVGMAGAAIAFNGESNTSLIKNNIFDHNGQIFSDSTGMPSTNLCNTLGFGCAIVGDPGFAQASNGDFHIGTAASSANNAGANLSGTFTTDIEGLSRPPSGAWTIGAYQFAAGPPPPNPDPGTIVADYAFDAGSGTTVTDSTTYNNVGTWTECAGNACWTTGITGPFAGNFNGTRAVQITDTTGLKPTGAISLVARIHLTDTGVNGCDVVTIGDSAKIHVGTDGNVSGQVYVAGNWHEPFSSGLNILAVPQNHLLTMSYDGADVRVYLDGAQVAIRAVSGPISYTLGPNAQIGRHGNNETTYGCTGVIDHVRILNGYCNAFCQANFFNETVPVVGLSIAHTGWYSTGIIGANSEIARDATLLNWLITTPLALRFALRKNDPGSLTEYFPPVCLVDTGAGFPPWSAAVALTNSFGALGIRYYADAAITQQGQATSVLLPTDGSTPVAGKILKNPIAAAPYPTNQKVTIAQGQQADVQIQMEFGSPLVGGNRVQCRLIRENDVDLTGYANIYPVRLQGIAPPTSLRVGTTQQGGTFQ